MALMVATIVGKLAGPWLIRAPWPTRWIIGNAMIPRGEVGLIFFELGQESGILNNETYAGMVIVIAIMTVLSPFVMKGLYNRFSHRLQTAEGF